VTVLSERVEGNLLAAAQEIEKLALTGVDQRPAIDR
jgi:DNA polymerase III delta subunit